MTSHSIYLIAEEDSEFVKVGVGISPHTRMCTLQTGNPRKLRLIYTEEMPTKEMAYQAEYRAHGCMIRWRVEGEWFNMPASYAEQEVKWACNFVRNAHRLPYYKEKLRQRSLGFDYQEIFAEEIAAEAEGGDPE